jgi:hypothetical protein
MGSAVVRVSDKYVGFHCPGCDDYHQIRTGENGWTWDGSAEAPTFSPSVLVTYAANPDASDEFAEWRTARRCHSFVRAGRIEFLSDCTHALAGQTVDLPEWKGF